MGLGKWEGTEWGRTAATVTRNAALLEHVPISSSSLMMRFTRVTFAATQLYQHGSMEEKKGWDIIRGRAVEPLISSAGGIDSMLYGIVIGDEVKKTGFLNT